MQPIIQPFFDINTGTMTYVVFEQAGSAAAIIDPVLDYDPKAARTSTRSADAVIAFAREQRLDIEWILETHAHADHLSAAPYLKRMLGGKIGIGESIWTVQVNIRTGRFPEASGNGTTYLKIPLNAL